MTITDIIRNLHALSLNDLILLSQAVDEQITEITEDMEQHFLELIGSMSNDN